jgi:hypothetical protein
VRGRAPFIGNFGQSRLGPSRLGPLPDWGFDPTYLLGMHEMPPPAGRLVMRSIENTLLLIEVEPFLEALTGWPSHLIVSWGSINE